MNRASVVFHLVASAPNDKIIRCDILATRKIANEIANEDNWQTLCHQGLFIIEKSYEGRNNSWLARTSVF